MLKRCQQVFILGEMLAPTFSAFLLPPANRGQSISNTSIEKRAKRTPWQSQCCRARLRTDRRSLLFGSTRRRGCKRMSQSTVKKRLTEEETDGRCCLDQSNHEVVNGRCLRANVQACVCELGRLPRCPDGPKTEGALRLFPKKARWIYFPIPKERPIEN